ncbi:MAG TPA: YciI-like protein [Steroidobacteraceae bacterium]|nr:YciI-like protein [Steroidobacteraceae bacterium]
MHFLVFYEFTPDYMQRRAPYRAEHLRLAWEAQARGELVLGGALADPPDRAVLLFKGDSELAARAFAENDPYVKSGLVTHWSVRPWTTVVGEAAATPLRRVTSATTSAGSAV